jgi:hypothetical protein
MYDIVCVSRCVCLAVCLFDFCFLFLCVCLFVCLLVCLFECLFFFIVFLKDCEGLNSKAIKWQYIMQCNVMFPWSGRVLRPVLSWMKVLSPMYLNYHWHQTLYLNWQETTRKIKTLSGPQAFPGGFLAQTVFFTSCSDLGSLYLYCRFIALEWKPSQPSKLPSVSQAVSQSMWSNGFCIDCHQYRHLYRCITLLLHHLPWQGLASLSHLSHKVCVTLLPLYWVTVLLWSWGLHNHRRVYRWLISAQTSTWDARLWDLPPIKQNCDRMILWSSDWYEQATRPPSEMGP